MPQLDSATFLSQAFWLILCFCTLWALLSLFITPKLTEVLEARKRKISDYIQKADALNTQAKLSLERYNSMIAKANDEADQALKEGKKDVEDFLDKEQRKLTAELKQEISENEQTLAKEKKQTLRQIEGISHEVAFAVVHKLGFTEITQQDIIDLAREDKNNG